MEKINIILVAVWVIFAIVGAWHFTAMDYVEEKELGMVPVSEDIVKKFNETCVISLSGVANMECLSL